MKKIDRWMVQEMAAPVVEGTQYQKKKVKQSGGAQPKVTNKELGKKMKDAADKTIGDIKAKEKAKAAEKIGKKKVKEDAFDDAKAVALDKLKKGGAKAMGVKSNDPMKTNKTAPDKELEEGGSPKKIDRITNYVLKTANGDVATSGTLAQCEKLLKYYQQNPPKAYGYYPPPKYKIYVEFYTKDGKHWTRLLNKNYGLEEAANGAENYTLGHPVDKEYTYQIWRTKQDVRDLANMDAWVHDGGTTNSLDDAKLRIEALKKGGSPFVKYKIKRVKRTGLAGPTGSLPEDASCGGTSAGAVAAGPAAAPYGVGVQKRVKEEAKWRKGYEASGHPPGVKHSLGTGPVGGTWKQKYSYGEPSGQEPVNKYRDETDPLQDRERAKFSEKGKPLSKKNAERNLKGRIKQSLGKHGPVNALPEADLNEGKVKELDMDFKELSPKAFKAKYKNTKSEMSAKMQPKKDDKKGKEIVENMARRAFRKHLLEGTWSFPESPEQKKVFNRIMTRPLYAGVAQRILYNVFGDDQLFDLIDQLKTEDGAGVDVRKVVMDRYNQLCTNKDCA